MIQLYNRDCLEAMKEMPDKAYDLAIVDPPYGIGEDGKSNNSRGKHADFVKDKKSKSKAKAISKTYKGFHGGDKEPASKDFFNELIRVSKNQIIWGANHFIENIPNKNSSCWIVWDKKNEANDFADCELAWTSFKTSVRKFSFRWYGMLQEDMKNKEIRIHPTQKPVKLYKWLLDKYAKQGDKILDTHLGSGSIAIACHDYGFDLTGFELDYDYYEAAKKRLVAHQSQIAIPFCVTKKA